MRVGSRYDDEHLDAGAQPLSDKSKDEHLKIDERLKIYAPDC